MNQYNALKMWSIQREIADCNGKIQRLAHRRTLLERDGAAYSCINNIIIDTNRLQAKMRVAYRLEAVFFDLVPLATATTYDMLIFKDAFELGKSQRCSKYAVTLGWHPERVRAIAARYPHLCTVSRFNIENSFIYTISEPHLSTAENEAIARHGGFYMPVNWMEMYRALLSEYAQILDNGAEKSYPRA